MTNDNSQVETQPCEVCGNTAPPTEEDKYDDLFTDARPGSKAQKLGLPQERLCGRCACAQFIGSYWNGRPDKQKTPLEQYLIRGTDRVVTVKRDDLWSDAHYGGGNAKMRGVEVHLRRLKEQGINHVAMMDARTSRAGWGVAELCRDMGLSYTGFYGRYKGELTTTPYDPAQFSEVDTADIDELPPFQWMAYQAGAQIISIPASRIYPMYYKTRIYCREHGIYLLPMGLQLQESMLSVAGEASTLPKKLQTGTIICVVATGTMFAGLLMGLRGAPAVIGVYIGMTLGELLRKSNTSDPEAIIRKRIAGLLPAGYETLDFAIALGDRQYYDEDNYPCPFSCDKWYDRKAWRWLCEHIDKLKDPVLFWNIG